MSPDFNSTLKYACRTNIERYQRLLKTYLTDHERQFVEHRLAEEQEALRLASKKDRRVDSHAA